MKKLLALVLAVVMMMGVASVAFAEETNSLAAVEAAGVLKVGIDAAFAPMTFKDETGAYTGYDIALATAVAEKLGVSVEFVEVDWSNLEAALNDGTIDCVWSGMSINAERQAAMTISAAYLESNTTLLVHKDVAGFIDDLAGKTVAVQGGSFAETILTNDFAHLFSAENIVKVADSDAGIAAVIAQAEFDAAVAAAKDAGKPTDDITAGDAVLAQAVILDSTYADYQIASNEALADFITIEELYADLFGIGFAKGDYLLCGAIEEALYELAQDGTIAALDAEWFGSDVSLIK